MELTIENVGKQYKGKHWGLKDFTLNLSPGVLGLLGPKGAGKSTLMNMLATVTKPTIGTILWNGIDIRKKPNELRNVLGYLPQDFGVYPNLNVIEFLEYMAAIKGLDAKIARPRIEELLQMVNLSEVRKRPLGDYSGGMRQRVGIAQALLNDPKLLIVDEPTVGLDPEERVRFRNLIADLSENRIIILSTHIVSDVEATATSIALINHGALLQHDTPEAILDTVKDQVWSWVIPSSELIEKKQKYLISSTIRRSDGIQIRVVNKTVPEAQAQPVTPTLEDAYLRAVSSKSQINGGVA
jgi:ABC-2 type transport system ATP-binding protein